MCQDNNLQVGVTLCLNDNIGEVGEAGEDMGRNVILGLGLWIGRKGEEGTEEGTDGGLEELLDDEKEVAGDIFLRSTHQDCGAAA